MFQLPTSKEYVLLIDFEATCSSDQTVPREEMEIIEIGAILLETKNLERLKEFHRFIKPVRHPTLTVFCIELTTITQEMVDNASGFEQALQEFVSEMIRPYGTDKICFASWGNYDDNQLRQDCDYHGLPFPFDEEYLNIKRWVAEYMDWKRPKGVGGALKALQMEFIGTPHRGIDDVRNMVRMLHQLQDQSNRSRKS